MKRLLVPCSLPVVAPVFNEGNTVRETLAALLAKQITGVQFEIIMA